MNHDKARDVLLTQGPKIIADASNEATTEVMQSMTHPIIQQAWQLASESAEGAGIPFESVKGGTSEVDAEGARAYAEIDDEAQAKQALTAFAETGLLVWAVWSKSVIRPDGRKWRDPDVVVLGALAGHATAGIHSVIFEANRVFRAEWSPNPDNLNGSKSKDRISVQQGNWQLDLDLSINPTDHPEAVALFNAVDNASGRALTDLFDTMVLDDMVRRLDRLNRTRAILTGAPRHDLHLPNLDQGV